MMFKRASRRHVLTSIVVAAASAVALPKVSFAQSKAETGTIVLAPQFGLAYTPLHVMKAEKLIEKHLAKNGLPNTKVEWQRTTGGSAANDALLSGSMHVVSGGIGPLLTIWDKTKGNANVRGIGCFDATALYLTTVNPAIKTLRDFTDKDRIALPAVKVSIQAVSLQMACEKEFGAGQHGKLDHLTVSMSHPDATAAMLSGRSEITAHFTSPPFQFQQIDTGKARKVLSNFDTLGGPVTFNSAYTTSKFRDENPRSYKSVFDALVEAHDFIQKRRDDAVKIYIAEEQSKLPLEFINKMMGSPELRHTIVPLNTIKYAEFMNRIGSLRNKAVSWKDYYFADVHDQTGS